jgi:hypothetical protein
MTFDPNCKNIVPMYLATVRGGKYDFRRYGMDAPYAKVAEGAIEYNGPAVADTPAGPVRIGYFGPDAERQAGQLAAAIAGYGSRYTLTPISSDAPWGKASDALVKLIYDDHALAVIAGDRNSSHLAEQLAVKAFVPVVALSSDRSLTSMKIPWIFRLHPETPPAEALRVLIRAAERSGPNRQRLREELAADSVLATQD